MRMAPRRYYLLMLKEVFYDEGPTGWRFYVFFKGVTGLGTLGDIFNRVDLVRASILGDPVARIMDIGYGLARKAVAMR